MGDSRHSKRRVGEPLVNLTINGDDSVRLFRGGMSQKKNIYIYIWVLGKIRAPWDCIY